MFRLQRFAVSLILFASAICLAQQPAAQRPLNNDAILLMARSKLGDDLIVQTINAQPGDYKTSPSDLVALKQAGLSDRVIGAMIGKGIPAANGQHEPAAQETAIPEGVEDIGVYYKGHDGKWMAVPPEIMNLKSGGILKSLTTNGMVRQDINGFVAGKAAQLALTRRTEILLYMRPGTDPEEFQLLHLRTNSNSRQFRSETGGFMRTTGGARHDLVPVQTTQVAPHMYRFTLAPDLPIGEYGVLPPGSMSIANAASGGKIYTFHLIE